MLLGYAIVARCVLAQELDLVHQTALLCERVGSGDKTTMLVGFFLVLSAGYWVSSHSQIKLLCSNSNTKYFLHDL